MCGALGILTTGWEGQIRQGVWNEMEAAIPQSPAMSPPAPGLTYDFFRRLLSWSSTRRRKPLTTSR